MRKNIENQVKFLEKFRNERMESFLEKFKKNLLEGEVSLPYNDDDIYYHTHFDDGIDHAKIGGHYVRSLDDQCFFLFNWINIWSKGADDYNQLGYYGESDGGTYLGCGIEPFPVAISFTYTDSGESAMVTLHPDRMKEIEEPYQRFLKIKETLSKVKSILDSATFAGLDEVMAKTSHSFDAEDWSERIASLVTRMAEREEFVFENFFYGDVREGHLMDERFSLMREVLEIPSPKKVTEQVLSSWTTSCWPRRTIEFIGQKWDHLNWYRGETVLRKLGLEGVDFNFNYMCFDGIISLKHVAEEITYGIVIDPVVASSGKNKETLELLEVSEEEYDNFHDEIKMHILSAYGFIKKDEEDFSEQEKYCAEKNIPLWYHFLMEANPETKKEVKKILSERIETLLKIL